MYNYLLFQALFSPLVKVTIKKSEFYLVAPVSAFLTNKRDALE